MLEFFQAHFFGVFPLCVVCVIVLFISANKIDLKRHGAPTAFSVITLTLLAVLLLLEGSPLQSLLVKIYVVVMMLFVWLLLFRFVKRRVKK